jgi:Domain of unknown function (DUF4440)
VADVAAELEDLERRGWEALSGPDGAAFYEDAMANDGLMVFPGMVMDKHAALDAIRSVEPWSRFDLTDVRVELAAGAVGLVTYRAKAERAGRPYEATMSSVYVRVGGAWRLVLHQQSPG